MPVIQEARVTDDQLVSVRWFVPVTITHWPITKFEISCYSFNQSEWLNITLSSFTSSATVNCLNKTSSNLQDIGIVVTALNVRDETSSQLKRLFYRHRLPTGEGTWHIIGYCACMHIL